MFPPPHGQVDTSVGRTRLRSARPNVCAAKHALEPGPVVSIAKEALMAPNGPRPSGLLCAALLVCVSVIGRPSVLAAGEPVSTPQPAAGPSVRRLTLEEARQIALSGNKALALARLNVEQLQHATNAASKDYFAKLLGSETYFHFNHDLGSVLTLRRGQRGILPPGVTTINAAVLNQDSSLGTVFVAQPITKLIAVNAAVQIARADENAAQAKLDKGTR